jgi:hypothetical protein
MGLGARLAPHARNLVGRPFHVKRSVLVSRTTAGGANSASRTPWVRGRFT